LNASIMVIPPIITIQHMGGKYKVKYGK